MSSAILAVFIVLSLVFLTIAGIVLIVLGIVHKKVAMWVPGAVMVLCAFIFCTAGFFLLLRNVTEKVAREKPSWNADRYTPYDEDENTLSDTAYVEKEEEGCISGFIQDNDKSLVHIKIIPDPVLKELGVAIDGIDTYNISGNIGKKIALDIDFSRKFKGTLILILYSADNEETGRSYLQISQEKNSAFTVKFSFDNETNFLKTKYARLKSSD